MARPLKSLPATVEQAGQQVAASNEPRLPALSRHHLTTTGQFRGTRIDRSEGAKALMALSVHLPEPPADYDPDTYYRVQLKRTIVLGGHNLRPRDDVIVLGSYAKEIADDISGAVKI